MDKFTLKADKVVREYIQPTKPKPGSNEAAIQTLGTAAKVATQLGATPKRRFLSRSGVTKLNKAMDGVLSKLADKIKKLESSL